MGTVHPATIRPARSTDAASLSELATRTWSDAFGESVSPDDEALLLTETRSEAYFIDALRESTILLAEDKGALLGYAQFGDVEISEIEVRPGDQALHRIYVDTDLQGRGLGRRLMKAALQHPRLAAASRIFLTVWERNERAIALYASLGFRRVGTTTFAIGSEVVEDLVFVLDRTATAEDS